MGVLTGNDEAKKQISTAETAFVGRLVSAKIISSTRSLPPTNHFKLEFEGNPKSVKGSAPTTNEFDYWQIGKGGKLIKKDGSMEDRPIPKEPQSGQFYVAIYNSSENSIENLIEINENDLSLFKS